MILFLATRVVVIKFYIRFIGQIAAPVLFCITPPNPPLFALFPPAVRQICFGATGLFFCRARQDTLLIKATTFWGKEHQSIGKQPARDYAPRPGAEATVAHQAPRASSPPRAWKSSPSSIHRAILDPD